MTDSHQLASSFRDPSGFLFRRENCLFRQVNRSYAENYDRLIDSGLYRSLSESGQLVPHEEVVVDAPVPDSAYKVLRPELVPFISYPYEWGFSQLQDAALLTLEIQRRSLEAGMSLKDCSAYNVQFKDGRPIFIDTLSFEVYREGEPWVAYRQFCQHFLAPLALMSRVDVRLSRLLRPYLDGIPLDLASRLLPRRTWLTLGLGVHIHLHAKSQSMFAEKTEKPKRRAAVSLNALRGLVDSLDSSVRKLKWRVGRTEWSDYYSELSYSGAEFDRKRAFVSEYLEQAGPSSVWDLGANTGHFSRLASDRGIPTVAFDIDPACVEADYREVVRRGETKLLPLWLDLTNPSPGLGWAGAERMSLADRGPVDLVMALALIHHLAIGNNVPLGDVAAYLARLGRRLIIEFVPKSDPQVGRLLVVREDVFDSYTQADFEASFSKHFEVERSDSLQDGGRRLYLMRSRNPTFADVPGTSAVA
jgi:ribosomal protein L11 methylase PrmA